MTRKPTETSDALSRRAFLQRGGATAAAVAAPLVIPARLLGPDAPSNRVRVGHIGCGRIAQGHDMVGVAGADLADVLAVADLDSRRAASGKARVERLFAARNAPKPTISVYTDYKELLARPDIDAVTISLPDHQHAEVALRALYAGKDVYLQKPFTMTHAEGLILRDAVARSKRVLQVGSQQRSWGPNEQFRKAVEFVRSGRVGTLRRVEIGLPIDPTKPNDPPQPVPSNLNYDMWLGPTPEAYYTEQRVHPQGTGRDGGPDVQSRPGWLRNENYSLGMITGWGAHHFDTAHWGMNMELTGPSKIEGKGEFPPHDRIWNVHGKYHIELTYPGNVIMTVSDELPNGIKWIGDDGWIFVSRDATQTASDPTGRATSLKSLDASDPKLLDPNGVTVHMPHSLSHHKNWLECVKSRATPLAPAPIAHRANAACILSWIAMKLGRPIEWDAEHERFVNDAEATAMLSRPERGPYGATRLAASHSKTWSPERMHRITTTIRRLAPAGAAALLLMASAPASAQQPAQQGTPRADSARFRLLTLDPGHFHASLVQKFMYPDVDSVVWVYSAGGDDLAQHLARIELFNTRKENPTHWVEKVYTGPDFLDRMIADRKGNIVVISGNNARKTEYIVRSIDAGLNVLADKPMVRTPADLVRLKQAFATAERKHVLLYDIMTERNEVTTALQRQLSMDPALFGTLVKGTTEHPAITKVSVHLFKKIVAGQPLKRPEWFFDVRQQGEGIVDVTTHLVDLVQWEAFPGVTLTPSDVHMINARRWVTPISLAQFEQVTGADSFPDYLKRDVKDGVLQDYANGEMNYTLKGVHARVSDSWQFEGPPGSGDTHFSIMRGTKATLMIRQGAEQKYKPVLSVERDPSVTPAAHEAALHAAVEHLQGRWPGVAVHRDGDHFVVDVPPKYDVGHEAHFAQVTSDFLRFLREGEMPEWEVPNMIVKYHTIMQAYAMSRGK